MGFKLKNLLKPKVLVSTFVGFAVAGPVGAVLGATVAQSKNPVASAIGAVVGGPIGAILAPHFFPSKKRRETVSVQTTSGKTDIVVQSNTSGAPQYIAADLNNGCAHTFVEHPEVAVFQDANGQKLLSQQCCTKCGGWKVEARA